MVDAKRAAIGEMEPAVELRPARKHGRGRAGQQALEARDEIDAEAPLGSDARHPGRALGVDALACVEIEVRVPVIEGTAPIKVEIDWGRAGEVGALREQAASRLDEARLHLQLLALRHEPEVGGEKPCGIEAADVHLKVEALYRRAELRLAVGRQPRRLARKGLAEHEFAKLEGFDLDLHRQLWKERAVGLQCSGVG